MAGWSELLPAHLDLLKEIGNIGAAHAADALSILLSKRIDMRIPSVNVIPLTDIVTAETEKHVAATYIQVEGDIKGYFFMMFEVPLANRLIQEIVPEGTVLGDEIAESAFCEIGNILCGSYLSALATFLNIHISQTPPIYAIDMEGAILGEGLAELSLYDDSVILIDAVLSERLNRKRIEGEFFFLPVAESLEIIFKLAERKSSL
ncbi:MAG: chemotaxis protein CheC [Sporolactobacillus sp.]